MINKIKILGYKCLNMTEPLNVRALNVLVGANASGKSSLLQTILLLRQSADENGCVRNLRLSGPLYEGGTAVDVLHPEAEHKMLFQLFEKRKPFSFNFELKREEVRGASRLLHGQSSVNLPKQLGDKNGEFCYLNAERIGPRVSYPLPLDRADLAGEVGKYGEYTAALLARSANGRFIEGWDSKFSKLFSNAVKTLDQQDIRNDLTLSGGRLDLVCNLLLGWILPGAFFQASEDDRSDSGSLQFVRDPNATRVVTRATHVGFGLAYALPIIAGALALNKTGVLLVENPEAHLHPFSQSRIGAFLAVIASTGRQVFVETHSDHVVNGVRLAVKYGLVKASDIVFNYFSNIEEDNSSKVEQIYSDSDGTLDDWPKGFFDQIERDLSRL